MKTKPLFLVGAGRSGSSFLAELISRHPDLSFLTSMAAGHPETPRLNRLALQSRRVPLLGRFGESAFPITEAYPFWERYAPGFSSSFRDLRRDDMTPRVRSHLPQAIVAAMDPGRPWFFAKLTGWGRIGFLDELFFGARFIHLVRDGRDVASSFLKVRFWKGWEGPSNWRFGPLPMAYQQIWEDHDESFVVLAGLCWKMLVNSIEQARREIPESSYMRVRYEDFVARPGGQLRKMLEFGKLEWTDEVQRGVDNAEVKDMRGRHRSDLSRTQVVSFTNVLEPELRRFGYNS